MSIPTGPTPHYEDDLITLYRANALDLPLADNSVDLVVTSPPYFGLRSYQDGGDHYDGQIGAEATPTEFVDALIAATREMVRVTKPTGSIWVNLGDKYNSAASGQNGTAGTGMTGGRHDRMGGRGSTVATMRPKSLMGIPWRYAIRCIDDLGLILRAEVVWSKPNGLPESVTDRVRRSHETWFHFTLNPRYYSAVDEVREAYLAPHATRTLGRQSATRGDSGRDNDRLDASATMNPLGKLPGSVWTIATEPLRVPEELGIDHFAAFPTEFPRRIITGWSPRGVCDECGEGRRPVVDRERMNTRPLVEAHALHGAHDGDDRRGFSRGETTAIITGEACDCPEPTAPTTPGVVLDPFSGTGTTALVASVLGRHGIGVDMSEDYCRLAKWRTTDPKQRARAARKPWTPPAEQLPGQGALDFGGAV